MHIGLERAASFRRRFASPSGEGHAPPVVQEAGRVYLYRCTMRWKLLSSPVNTRRT